MSAPMQTVRLQAEAAREAGRILAQASGAAKNEALERIAQSLSDRDEAIVAANAQDCTEAEAGGLAAAFLDRLRLTPERLAAQAADVRQIAHLDDPVGETIDERVRPNGLQVERVRVPIGVIGAIYESRPNVTVDITALCLKSGNACVLRGGKEALRSNRLLAELCRQGAGRRRAARRRHPVHRQPGSNAGGGAAAHERPH